MIRMAILLTACLLGTGLSPLLLAADAPKKPNPFTDGKAEPNKKEKPVDEVEDKAAARVAHIKLSGDLSEAPVEAQPLFGAPPENLMIKLDRIRKAAGDDRIDALYLELGALECGFGKLNEVRQAILDFRKTGKKAFAYCEELGTKDYLVALACDQVMIPVSGGLNLYGLRAEVTFYKNTLELLKVKADVLKMGDFKSAVEPFLRNDLSDANRKQITSMLNDNFENGIVGLMIASRPDRKWTPDQVEAAINQGPFTAKKALELKLIDQIAYDDELNDRMAKALEVESVKVLKDYGKIKAKEIDFSNPFAMLSAFSGAKKTTESTKPKIAVIYAIGGIASGKSSLDPLMGGETVGSQTLVEAVRQADKDDTVKAIVLRIDSPGGSALASDIMWRALTQCKKPVVASMSDVAASGGYYIAAAGKKIYAEPGTITGSIGVFGMKLIIGDLQKWGGMNTEVISRGKNSGVNSSTFAWTESEREVMTKVIEEVYEQFLDRAIEGRKRAGSKLTRDELKALAGGRVWTGRQAKANGLVDELGTLRDAIGGAKALAGIDPKQEMELLILPKASSFLDRLAEGDMPLPFGSLRAQLETIPGAAKVLKLAAPLLRTHRDPAKVLMPYYLEWK